MAAKPARPKAVLVMIRSMDRGCPNSSTEAAAPESAFCCPPATSRYGRKGKARFALIKRRLAPSQSFNGRAIFLRFQPSLARSRGRPGRSARNRRDGGAADQFDQAVERVLAVAFLGAVALGQDNDDALPGEAVAGQPLEARGYVRGSDELRTSKRSCTAVASLLTFCPPGPDARMKRSSISRSPMLMRSLIRIMA